MGIFDVDDDKLRAFFDLCKDRGKEGKACGVID